MIRLLYRLLVCVALPGALLRVVWRARRQPEYLKNLPERFGRWTLKAGGHPIWIHAVSVGETRAAEPLIRSIQAKHPDIPILLTCTTPTGRATGEQLFGHTIRQAYLPYDLPHAVRRFLRTHQPRLGVLMETELWPELILGCQVQAIPLYIVNARLSERSARRYAYASSFTSQVLNAATAIATQSRADTERFLALGAQHVVTCGNLKFDRSAQPSDFLLAEQLRRRIGPRPVLLVASTRQGEEALFLEAWRDVSRGDVLLALVPRHPQRFDEVAKLIEHHGLSHQRRSRDGPVSASTQVWLGDSMGEMFAYYAACDMAVIGGGFLELGGQNLLEACAVGKPAIVGPHMFNFEEATRSALAAQAAVRVHSASEALNTGLALLKEPDRLRTMGEAGRALMQAHQGATQRILKVLGV